MPIGEGDSCGRGAITLSKMMNISVEGSLELAIVVLLVHVAIQSGGV